MLLHRLTLLLLPWFSTFYKAHSPSLLLAGPASLSPAYHPPLPPLPLVPAATLQHVTVSTISDSECKSTYGSNQILGGMFCAGTMAGGKDSCQGDSGG